jgi:hypothetical protein
VISRFGIREGSAMEKSGEIEVEEFAPIDLDLDFDVPDVPEFDQERHRRESEWDWDSFPRTRWALC